MLEAKEVSLTKDVVAKLAELAKRADDCLAQQRSYTKLLDDVLDGSVLLTLDVVAKVQTAGMIARQMTAVVRDCVEMIRESLPADYRDGQGHCWVERSAEVLQAAEADFRNAMESARVISSWARSDFNDDALPPRSDPL